MLEELKTQAAEAVDGYKNWDNQALLYAREYAYKQMRTRMRYWRALCFIITILAAFAVSFAHNTACAFDNTRDYSPADYGSYDDYDGLREEMRDLERDRYDRTRDLRSFREADREYRDRWDRGERRRDRY